MKKVFLTIKQICLIDKILMVYMVILLVYIAIHIICGRTLKDSTSIDTIIRTSASAIFGYFISNNFVRSNSDADSKNTTVSDDAKPVAKENTNTSACCSSLQIMIVSVIGIISLALLLISRSYSQTTAEISATVSQLRDFLSASIGFLISCGKTK